METTIDVQQSFKTYSDDCILDLHETNQTQLYLLEDTQKSGLRDMLNVGIRMQDRKALSSTLGVSSKLSFTKQPQLSKVVKPFNDYLTLRENGKVFTHLAGAD